MDSQFDILNNILKVGISLEPLGVKNWALSKSDALRALDEFLDIKIPILGGDVCERVDGLLQYNYDNWYCDKLPGETKLEFANRSIKIARDYIENYNFKGSGEVFFVFVPDVQ